MTSADPRMTGPGEQGVGLSGAGRGTSVALPAWWLERAKAQRIVLMAGAGVSAAPPSSLPGWYEINRMIVAALGERIDGYFVKPGYTAEVRGAIDARRSDQGFPPDYQAQILEENCGADYFRALQSLDVDACNPAHEGIAWLAQHGALAAVVTTNFDRLIERALEAQGVAFQVAYEPKSYARCLNVLDGEGTLQVLKVHGCVQDHRSLVDTLKQRLLGRNRELDECLSRLLTAHPWVFLGFSAADLETDDGYLRLIPGAASSPGIAYVQWPGSPELSKGAQQLKQAYGTRFAEVRAESSEFLAGLGVSLGIAGAPAAGLAMADTRTRVSAALDQWAQALHPAAAVNCFATLAEAAGQAEAAFWVLHRFWKDVISTDRSGPDFERYRFQHGRLGIGGGLLSAVDDLDTDVGMESHQNLLRVAAREPRANAWEGVAWVWAGRQDRALSLLSKASQAFKPDVAAEIRVDVWLASAEAAFGLWEFEDCFRTVRQMAKIASDAGDLPREAKVWALGALFYAEFTPDGSGYPDYMRDHAGPVLERARRLNDPVIEGFAALAEGRYLTKQRAGMGAIEALDRARNRLIEAARPPWGIFAAIEYAKALYDHGSEEDVDRAGDLLQEIANVVDKWQLWLPWLNEVYVQRHLILGKTKEARQALEEAIRYAEAFGLTRKAESLRVYFQFLPPSGDG